MRKSVARSVSVLVLAVAGCGGSSKPPLQTVGINSDATATLALGSLLQTMTSALAGVMPARSAPAARPPAAVASASYDFNCDSGSGSVVISIDTGSGTLSTSNAMTFHDCTTTRGTLDGTLTFSQSLTTGSGSTAGTVGLDGVVAYQSADGQYAGTFAFTGMALTFDCNATGCATFTVTGTYTVGGVTYQVDETSFEAILAGL